MKSIRVNVDVFNNSFSFALPPSRVWNSLSSTFINFDVVHLLPSLLPKTPTQIITPLLKPISPKNHYPLRPQIQRPSSSVLKGISNLIRRGARKTRLRSHRYWRKGHATKLGRRIHFHLVELRGTSSSSIRTSFFFPL